MQGWAPLDAVAEPGAERAGWLARIARGEVSARADPHSGEVVVWTCLDGPRLDALLRSGLHRRLHRLVDARAALPELCERLARASRRGRTLRFPRRAASRRRAA